jgi:hypothetical protein
MFTKNGLGYLTGNFFTNASGHPGDDRSRCQKKGFSCSFAEMEGPNLASLNVKIGRNKKQILVPGGRLAGKARSHTPVSPKATPLCRLSKTASISFEPRVTRSQSYDF